MLISAWQQQQERNYNILTSFVVFSQMNPIRSIEYQILLLNQNKAIDKISTISIQIDLK